MSEREPTLEEIMKLAMHYREFEVHCALPGRIKSYDASKQLADVEVCINPTLRCDGGDEVVVLGTITNVPIEFPSGGGYFISFPLQEGDPVKLTFHDRSLDDWMSKGGVVTESDLRMHHLSDASAYPGLRAQPQKLSSASSSKLVIGKDGDPSMQITIDGSTIKLSDNAANFVALANKVLTELQGITNAFNGHTHAFGGIACSTGVISGATATGPSYTPQSVAAQKVKAE